MLAHLSSFSLWSFRWWRLIRFGSAGREGWREGENEKKIEREEEIDITTMAALFRSRGVLQLRAFRN